MNITITIQCVECEKYFEITVNDTDYADWKNGKLIQNAMPYLSADERELIMSHWCSKCFDILFQ